MSHIGRTSIGCNEWVRTGHNCVATTLRFTVSGGPRRPSTFRLHCRRASGGTCSEPLARFPNIGDRFPFDSDVSSGVLARGEVLGCRRGRREEKVDREGERFEVFPRGPSATRLTVWAMEGERRGHGWRSRFRIRFPREVIHGHAAYRLKEHSWTREFKTEGFQGCRL